MTSPVPAEPATPSRWRHVECGHVQTFEPHPDPRTPGSGPSAGCCCIGCGHPTTPHDWEPITEPATPAELVGELTRELPKARKQFDRMMAGVAKAIADQNPDDVLARVFHGMLTEPDREAVAATAAMAVLELAVRRADASRSTVPGPAPTTWALPEEPPPDVVELWDHDGERWCRLDRPLATGQSWVPWDNLGSEVSVAESAAHWDEVVHEYGPLSSLPPGTEAVQ